MGRRYVQLVMVGTGEERSAALVRLLLCTLRPAAVRVRVPCDVQARAAQRRSCTVLEARATQRRRSALGKSERNAREIREGDTRGRYARFGKRGDADACGSAGSMRVGWVGWP